MESNCPGGLWAGLEPVGPVDAEEWAAWQKAQMEDVVRKADEEKFQKRLRPAIIERLKHLKREQSRGEAWRTIESLGMLAGLGHERALSIAKELGLEDPDVATPT